MNQLKAQIIESFLKTCEEKNLSVLGDLQSKVDAKAQDNNSLIESILYFNAIRMYMENVTYVEPNLRVYSTLDIDEYLNRTENIKIVTDRVINSLNGKLNFPDKINNGITIKVVKTFKQLKILSTNSKYHCDDVRKIQNIEDLYELIKNELNVVEDIDEEQKIGLVKILEENIIEYTAGEIKKTIENYVKDMPNFQSLGQHIEQDLIYSNHMETN